MHKFNIFKELLLSCTSGWPKDTELIVQCSLSNGVLKCWTLWKILYKILCSILCTPPNPSSFGCFVLSILWLSYHDGCTNHQPVSTLLLGHKWLHIFLEKLELNLTLKIHCKNWNRSQNNLSIIRVKAASTEMSVSQYVCKLWIKTVKLLFWSISQELHDLLKFQCYFWVFRTIYWKIHILSVKRWW